MPISQRVFCFVLFCCQVHRGTSVRTKVELVQEESSIKEAHVVENATSMTAAAQHHDARSVDNQSLVTDSKESSVIRASLISDDKENLANHGRRPNKGAVCCQRKSEENRCCTADQVSRRAIRECGSKRFYTNSKTPRCRTTPGHKDDDTEVEFWHVVWQYKQDGSSAKCTGNWWATWGFGSTKYCEDPVKVASDTQMYRLQDAIELTNAAPVEARCCYCNNDVSIRAYYSASGNCKHLCRNKGGLDSADRVKSGISGSHRAQCRR